MSSLAFSTLEEPNTANDNTESLSTARNACPISSEFYSYDYCYLKGGQLAEDQAIHQQFQIWSKVLTFPRVSLQHPNSSYLLRDTFEEQENKSAFTSTASTFKHFKRRLKSTTKLISGLCFKQIEKYNLHIKNSKTKPALPAEWTKTI